MTGYISIVRNADIFIKSYKSNISESQKSAFLKYRHMGYRSFLQDMQKLSESQQRMQCLILWCNHCSHSSRFHPIYDAFSGKPGIQRQSLIGGAFSVFFWRNGWYHMDTGVSNVASNVSKCTVRQHGTFRRKNQWTGRCIYGHITCIIKNAASNSIATELWQLNNCQVLNFQGA